MAYSSSTDRRRKRMKVVWTSVALLVLTIQSQQKQYEHFGVVSALVTPHRLSAVGPSSSSAFQSRDYGPSTSSMGATISSWSEISDQLAAGSAQAMGRIHDFAIPSITLPNWETIATIDPSSIMETVVRSLEGTSSSLPPEVQTVESLIGLAVSGLSTPWHVEAVVGFALGATVLKFLSSPLDFSDAPFEPGTDTYSPIKSDAFYAKRPLMVVQRLLQLGFISGSFSTGLLWDWLVLGKLLKDEEYTALKRNEARRAKESLRLCERLGPTFIKLGQALSIRQDLIPDAYALELRALQDAVSPFPNDKAYAILRNEFGVDDLTLIFKDLTAAPVAAASVGQVYKGTLAVTDKEVAVKVQRPGILSEIALDLYILRLLTPLQTRLQNAVNGVATEQDDIDLAVRLVDEWGRGFVAETDYRLEAQNTMNFEAAMRKRNLDAVCAPTVVPELVRDKVLVTEWVQGTRLDLDVSPDVPRLCGVALNAYLTMLLDTGCLHCDPHKGNLLRTTDGRLCILDWGMTLEVPRDLQYSLLEFIAHINIEDYDAIPQDFINLGFTPPDVTPERLQSSGITEGLSFTFRQLAAGGGPTKIQERVKAEFKERYGSDLSDEELRVAARAEMKERMEAQLAAEGVDVKAVTNIMEEVSRRNRELFSLPPYVLYLARAFSTLEGIGLSIDENYSIIQECYPYLASRLFTDRNPRAKKALKAMLGLTDDDTDSMMMVDHMEHNPNSALALVRAAAAEAASSSSSSSTTTAPASKSGLSPAKLVEMSEGFASYTSATGNVDRDGRGQVKAATEFAKLFFDPKGSTLQDILVDETAKFGDALTRAALRAALVDNPAAKAASSMLKTPKQIFDQNEQLGNFFFPSPIRSLFIDRPADIPDLVQSLLASTDEDERILTAAQELSDMVEAQIRTTTTTGGGGGGGGGADDNNGGTTTTSRDTAQQRRSDVTSAVSTLLSDDETRTTLTEQIPGAVVLGRRIGAGLFRRAAYRTDRTRALPEGARKRVSDVNRALADAIEPRLLVDDDDVDNHSSA